MVTVATGAANTLVTMMVAWPEIDSLVAVILAEPDAIAVTSPVADTVATDVALLDHAIVRPVRAFPAASRRIAVAMVRPPTTIIGDPSEAATLLTAGTLAVTVMFALPDADSYMA